METLEKTKLEKTKTKTQTVNTTGSLAIIYALLSDKVDTFFGYPGGAIMNI